MEPVVNDGLSAIANALRQHPRNITVADLFKSTPVVVALSSAQNQRRFSR